MTQPKPLPVPMFLDTRDEWMDAAERAMDVLVARGGSFTADALRDMVPVPGNPNWFGIVFRRFVNLGLIEQVGFELSRSKSRRGGVLRRWAPVEVRRG